MQNFSDLVSSNPLSDLLLLIENHKDDVQGLLGLPPSEFEETINKLKQTQEASLQEGPSPVPPEVQRYKMLLQDKIKEALLCLKAHNISLIPETGEQEIKEKFQRMQKRIAEAKLHGKNEPASLQELLEIPHQTLGEVYTLARNFYEKKQNDDAIGLLALITQLNPFYSNVWFLMGLAIQAKHEYDPALISYSMAIILDPTNIDPFLRTIECYLLQKDFNMASDFIQMVNNRIDSFKNPDRDRFERELALLTQRAVSKK